jgi:hypothetical protein
MNLAWSFKAGNKSSKHLRVVSDAMKQKITAYTRRTVVPDFSYPALKGWAKFVTTLRVGFSGWSRLLKQAGRGYKHRAPPEH